MVVASVIAHKSSFSDVSSPLTRRIMHGTYPRKTQYTDCIWEAYSLITGATNKTYEGNQETLLKNPRVQKLFEDLKLAETRASIDEIRELGSLIEQGRQLGIFPSRAQESEIILQKPVSDILKQRKELFYYSKYAQCKQERRIIQIYKLLIAAEKRTKTVNQHMCNYDENVKRAYKDLTEIQAVAGIGQPREAAFLLTIGRNLGLFPPTEEHANEIRYLASLQKQIPEEELTSKEVEAWQQFWKERNNLT